MANSDVKAVQIKPLLTAETRHPIKAARLLYSTPSYILRAPIYLVFVILFAGIVYSFWAKKDILVEAPLVLERESYTIEAVGAGMVANILAKEDRFVNASDPLIEVQEQIRVSMTPEQQMLQDQEFELRRELDKIQDEYDHNLAQLQLDLMDMTKGGETGQRAAQGRITRLEEQWNSARRARDRQAGRLGLANKQLQRVKALFDQHDITISEMERAQENYADAAKALDDAEARITETEIALQTAKDELAQLSALHRKEKLEQDIVQLKERRARDVKRLNEQIASIENKLNKGSVTGTVEYSSENFATYKSEFDGLLTRIQVKNGQIIAPGTPLVTIIKETSILEGHVFVDNKDIGNLRRGQVVNIKYYAYPYQEYGIASGVIASIATTPSGLPGKESKYLVKVVLRNSTISRLGGKPKALEMGLEGVAEIKTGDKRFIEIVFTPISSFFAPEEEA